MKKLAFIFGFLILLSPVLAEENKIVNFQLIQELIIVIIVLGIIALIVHKLL